MFFRNPLEEQLRKWGKGKQYMPANALDMKNRVFSFVPVVKPKPSRFFIGALSGVLAVLLLFVGNEFLKSKPTTSVPSAPQYYTGGCGAGETCDLSAPFMAVADGELGIQSGAETGLGASDIRTSHPIVAKVADLFSSAANTPVEIQDTREFLQYGYQANIKTRKVKSITNRLQTIVRGYGGRVDSFSFNDKFGSLHFVIPKSSLDAFKNEVGSLVNYRFYSESIQAQNLLPEKISIEQSTDATNESLYRIQQELTSTTNNHKGVLANLQKQLNSTTNRINTLRREYTTSTVRQEQISAELSGLYSAQASWQRQIAQENQAFNARKIYLEGLITERQSELSNLAQQDKQLVNTVETVQGSIEVEWVRVFTVFGMYVPYWWAWLILLCACALVFNYYSKRRVIWVE
ncbi:MAG: DUF4349 domain-containing protein [Candidatus Magasanikbacteria bacterium]|nr:DUF4349 domain-containing protein [Candidatus Magasanikbacteria bacterium]